MRLKDYSSVNGKLTQSIVNSVEFAKNSIIYGLFIIINLSASLFLKY